MPFAKVQKNKAYYKRIQTKYRRRREGKTDYFARRKMVNQDKNKYNSPKYRLVARITNKRVITQVVYSTMMGDKTICQATSTELKNKYDMPVGLTNYASCYATGLLLARRMLKLVDMDEDFQGVEEADAEKFHVEDEGGERRPFKVIFDCGLTRTIPGSRIFGVLKGAADGGLHIPHNEKKFPGYQEPEERGMPDSYDAAAHLERILGNHVSDYMEHLQEEDPERYKAQFAKYLDEGLEAGDLEDKWKEVHAKIRENPEFEKEPLDDVTNTRCGNWIKTSDGKKYCRKVKGSKAQRKNRVAQKLDKARKAVLAQMEADDDDDEE